MSQRPFLSLSDAPAGITGLGRIHRELLQHMVADPATSAAFHIASLGIGGTVSQRLPWFQYPVLRIQDMIVYDLPDVMRDHCKASGSRDRPFLFACLNASWCPWLADPTHQIAHVPLREYLSSGFSGRRPFDLSLYVPIDGHTQSGKLPVDSIAALRGADRALCYTAYGSSVVDRALGRPQGTTPFIPHGIDRTLFYPRDRALARQTFISRVSHNPANTLPVRDDMILLNCVATNSLRKNAPLVFDTCAELLRRGHNIFLWYHTPAVVGHWNLAALAEETGMANRTIVTCSSLSSDDLAWAYSACDCNLANGSGEGFGFVPFESLACGVPTVHHDYAGAAEFLLPAYKVTPIAYQVESTSMILRPIGSPVLWADAVEGVLGIKAELPAELDWEVVWPQFRSWLLRGIDK